MTAPGGGPTTPGQMVELVVVEDLKRTQIVQYAGASGDFNPLHTDEPYAVTVVGYPSVFAHGMLTMGMVGRVLTEGWGHGAVRRFGGRFVAQVWPGDSLTARATVQSAEDRGDETRIRLAVEGVNQDGRVVFDGEAEVAVPR